VEANKLPEGGSQGDTLTDSENRRWQIREIEGDQATVDAKHPLAGKTLMLDVAVVSIQ
jgi:FKBP-type peptidyl-prolyl cis-trans isomerase 2